MSVSGDTAAAVTARRYADGIASGARHLGGALLSGVEEHTVERWKLTYANRDGMLGEVPARYETVELEADTEGLDEQADERTILDKLHHIITEHTDGAGVLTGAEKIEA